MGIVSLEVDDLLAMHAELLRESGEDVGWVNRGCVESSLAMPQASFAGVERYPSLAAKAAAYLVFLANNHCFGQGNKRIAAMAMVAFLHENGFELGGRHLWPGQIASLVLDIVKHRCEHEGAERWIDRRLVTSPR